MVGTHSEFPSTDFAITSVNVPDRLDQREFDDRKLQDEASFYARRRWRSALRIWSRRLLPYLMLLAVLGLAGSWLAEQREAMAAGPVSQRLSAALHVPVLVHDTRLQTRWGDVVISPTAVTYEQANQLLTWLALVDRVVPDSVTRVRFAQLRFPGSALLPDRYDAVSRRDPSGQFTLVTLRRQGGPGSMQLQVTPDRSGGPIAFQCDAADWQPPFAPRTSWSELVANGHISSSSIQIDKFSMGSAFGAIEGQLLVQRDEKGAATWTATGQVNSVGIDVATVIQQISKSPQPPEGTPASAAASMSGTPAFIRHGQQFGVDPVHQVRCGVRRR